ncbi:protease adaptor protein YjbH [Staphylococcus simiae]|uniref:DsbA family protein n=1 Tax=Staphylococcus simiae TaxID=308354 RepID=UPI001A9679B8|nr:DsbA family protein [Staphylococcus simiae]MBO1199352.1 protease adaptor protein YjbH [Staphylococcus simiae]MBO1201657.1 protease adaptor protein YjbH [Staphylococcus simiae]MBO1203777.1 protease adaptor protein YjbH [Staphylococcus simiae]MBO1211679.1 protease adaptor protein YjbH [Staphylococcus simiae]MBO1230038.1 protease adaptor protein YjbH [Staphylococcus simiae]
MTEELRIMENKSREDVDLSPVSKIEIYSFFDPFSPDCFKLSAILSKLRIEYNQYIRIRHILNPSIKVLTKCQAQSTSDFDNIALAYKAAELQGRLKAERFIHLMQNEIIPKRDIITENMICDCIKNAGIDINVFNEDLQKSKLTESLKIDLHIAREMEIEQAPSLVFFSEDVHEEGLKVEGLYPYHIYTYIINELMGSPIEKKLPPKLETYIQQQQLVTMEELLTIYEWPEKLLNKELKKLVLQQKIEKLKYPDGDFWKSKMPKINTKCF